MTQAVLALGAAAVTAAGSAWYVPAFADLRAGADRPVSHRHAAAACLTGWTTTGIVAILLFVAEPWWMPCAAAAVGAVVTVGLRIRTVARRRRETQEAARHWARLGPTPPVPGTRRGPRTVALLIGLGLATATATATLAAAAGPEAGDWPAIAAWPSAAVALSVATAIAYTRACHRQRAGGADRRR
ncbi:hypothetical protein AB0F45_37630 [Streptomyces achromogenes]|uniref:hypothetical protein n=1 Tax=Streptomyces achromogenes TaxID=67255 RepID=UPI0022836871|nr:hypothetical protein [Streptomyces sp. UMAF16]